MSDIASTHRCDVGRTPGTWRSEASGCATARNGVRALPVSSLILCAAIAGVLAIAGCGKSQAEKALDSDANGYLCVACGEKFYTDRDVFASYCPKCRKPQIEQVLGFVCAADQHVTIDARGRGARACEKCGRPTSAVSIPREAGLRTWGAAKKTPQEVGG